MTVHTHLLHAERDGSSSILPGRVIFLLVSGTITAVGVCVALFSATGRDWWMLLRDPAAAFAFPHLGVLAMAMMGAICVFVAVLLRRGGRHRGVLLYVGILSLWLSLDDLFMLHEGILPRVVGIPEHVTLGLYVVAVLGLMRLIGGRVFTRAYLGFWVAAGFLVVMLATDIAFEVATSPSFLLEEVTKLCGFVLWAAFWIVFAARAMRGATAP
jgi:hypothetical protein